MRLRHAHARGGLVEAEQLRLRGQRDADLEVALLAVGQVGGQLPVLVAEPHRLQHGVGAVEHVGERAVVAQEAPGVPPRLGGDAHVLEHGRAGQDIGDLVRARHALPGDAIRGQPGDVLPVEHDAPARRPEHAGQAVEEGGLAGAVGADDGADLALLHGHRHVVERGEATEPHRETLGAEDDRGRGAPAVAGRGLRRRSGRHPTRTCRRRARRSSPWGRLPGSCACRRGARRGTRA